MVKQKIDTIFYDVDGTLLDSESLKYEGWKKAINKHGANFTEREYGNLSGIDHFLISQILIEEKGLNSSVSEFIQLKNKYTDPLFLQPIKSMHYALETLKYFENMKSALVTSDFRFSTIEKIAKSNLANLLYGVNLITREDVTKFKPNPEIYFKALDLMDAIPENCIVFEDTQAGVTSAKSAGLIPVALIDSRFTDKKAFENATHNYFNFEEAVSDLPNYYEFVGLK